ncbi:DivIVA domain-containing protein [Paramicrobacterium agarici]|uniref:DivIVA domain-containing protein n=1 Tax=Paramicrobacterium agarici TaxID=630514 RepID=A0A2A9DXH9_9MICO|nr:DivIVA domain-containing protein [Microbacterium agarici]PFG31507.1 DivIVA domain-containing protein [Microbacterium agarici]TQO21395.1 DivIVA domain-containing protein [Microbacterium agarici]
MTPHFPLVKHGKGYAIDEVDAFLARAREAYDETGDETMTSDDLRAASFSMKRKGYSPVHVDAALERLEDAFARRERDVAYEEQGRDRWLEDATTTAQVVLNRLARPDRERFRRVSFITQGYRREDVDAFARKIEDYFTDGAPISVDRVRSVVFPSERGGYDEAQVDAVLDAVVSVMLAVR